MFRGNVSYDLAKSTQKEAKEMMSENLNKLRRNKEIVNLTHKLKRSKEHFLNANTLEGIQEN